MLGCQQWSGEPEAGGRGVWLVEQFSLEMLFESGDRGRTSQWLRGSSQLRLIFFAGSRQQKFVRRLLEQNSIQDKMFFEVIVLR